MGTYKTLQSLKKRFYDSGDAFVEVVYLREKAWIAKLLAEIELEKLTDLQAEESFEAQKKKR